MPLTVVMVLGVNRRTKMSAVTVDGISYKIMHTCLGNAAIVREDGKECILPPWMGGYRLTHEWSILEADLVSFKLTKTDRATGKRIGWLGGRYADGNKPIEGADDPSLELVFV